MVAREPLWTYGLRQYLELFAILWGGKLTVVRSDAQVDSEDSQQRVPFRANQFHLEGKPNSYEALASDHYHEPRRRHFCGFPKPEENLAADLAVGANVQLGQFDGDWAVEGVQNADRHVRQGEDSENAAGGCS